MEEEEGGALPDHLRCKRTDGRQWRCKRRVMEDKKLCEIHHIQGRHRQRKQKVPESLKMQRKNWKRNAFEKNKLEIRAKLLKLAKPMKRKRLIGGESEALDEAVRKMKLKRGDLPLELIRMVLKREIEKKKKRKESDCSDFDEDEEEKSDMMRQLPNGLMAISSSSPHFDNAASCSGSGSGSGSVSGSCFNVKVGETETNTVAITRRRFRSKNIEPLPVGTLQVVPYKKDVVNLRRGRRVRCHWCRKGGVRSLIKCSSCRQHFFCLDCMKKQYFVTREEVKIACPVCRGTCGCKACSVSQGRDTECKEFLRDKNKVNKVLHFHYLICMLLPVLKRINQDQSVEIEVEAKIKGKKLCDIQVQPAEVGGNKQYCCNCKAFVLDFHRSCPKCSYNLCLSCCRDIFQGSAIGSIKELNCKCPNKRITCVPGIRLSDKNSVRNCKQNHDRYFDSSASLPSRKAPDGSVPISCPPTELGGCGDGLLDLRCILPLGWFKELEVSAEEIVGSYELPEAFDTFSCCSLCPATDYEAKGVKQLQEAARRDNSNDNFLFYPSVMNIHGDSLEHFQKHWGKGHPVIVRNVLQDTSDLSWDPIFLFCSYLKNSLTKSENEEELTKATGCSDWFEVEIGIKQLLLGSLRGPAQSNMCDEKLKLKGWLSSHLFQEQFPDHFAEIIRALPFPEYMDPRSGLLNIAARLPQEIAKPELGPCVSFSYFSGEELVQVNSVTKLHYNSCDVVNILAHATDAPVSMKQLNRIRKLMKKKNSHDQRELAKTYADQKMANEVKEQYPPCKNMGEVGMNDIIGKEMHAHDHLPKVSRSPSAVHEALGLGFNNGDADHGKEDSSDTDSDSDCNSNSEPALLLSHTIHSSEGLQNREVFGKRTKLAKSCGAEWDVFRRQDVPKLMEYLRKHSNEFGHICGFLKQVVHPILDQNFFLDTGHKIRLKEEYEVEPWTFEQHVGEAVIIPAGCPYQIRNVKSCVNVVLDFVSPENVTECIQLINELRLLPEDHKAKAEKFEMQQVKKMALYRTSSAIKEIRELTYAESSAELSE